MNLSRLLRSRPVEIAPADHRRAGAFRFKDPMANPNPSPASRFKPGQTGNASGRGHTRNRLTTKFLEALTDDFEQHGAEAIAKAREDNPDAYMRIIASLLPKELVVERAPLEGLTDDELAAAIAELRARRAGAAGAGMGMGEAEQAQPPGQLPPLH